MMKRCFPTLLFVLALAFNAHAQMEESARPFTWAERGTIYEADSIQPMRVLKISNYADSVFLRLPSFPVNASPGDSVLQHFVSRLYHTVRDSMSLGVGIAAPQVGIHRQIIWVQRFDKEEEDFPFEVFLNPVIKAYSDSTKVTPEGCLSIPDRRELVTRPCSIEIEYDRMDGTHQSETIDGFTSVIFQHEIDHLRGILYIDHVREEVREQRLKDKIERKE